MPTAFNDTVIVSDDEPVSNLIHSGCTAIVFTVQPTGIPLGESTVHIDGSMQLNVPDAATPYSQFSATLVAPCSIVSA